MRVEPARLNGETHFAVIGVTNDASVDRLMKKVLTFHKRIDVLRKYLWIFIQKKNLVQTISSN